MLFYTQKNKNTWDLSTVIINYLIFYIFSFAVFDAEDRWDSFAYLYHGHG